MRAGHDSFNIAGMNKDMSPSILPTSNAYDVQNMRFNPIKEGMMYSWVNEKGNKKINVYTKREGSLSPCTIHGVPIGYCVIGDTAVMFTTEPPAIQEPIIGETNTTVNTDRIYTLDYIEDHLECKVLFEGELGFSTSNPIEAIPSYENEDIKKVYWTDGVNIPRFINIADYGKVEWNSKSFDFYRDFQGGETVTIEALDQNGEFQAGTLQYSITYWNKFGVETSAFYTSPVLYTSKNGIGVAPNETAANAFKIALNNLDVTFTHVRVYSFSRSALNESPSAKLVTSLEIPASGHVSFIDDNTTGTIVDGSLVRLLSNGENSPTFTFSTMTQKDNTLFVGGIKEKSEIIIPTEIENSFKVNGVYFPTGYKPLPDKTIKSKSTEIKHFKGGETYRLGLVFQHKNTKWSNPVWIGDFENSKYPITNGGSYEVPYFMNTYSISDFEEVKNLGYVKVKPVVVFPSETDRSVICQGFVCPAVQYWTDEEEHYASSWFYRPYKVVDHSNNRISCDNADVTHSGEEGLLRTVTTLVSSTNSESEFPMYAPYYHCDTYIDIYSPDIEKGMVISTDVSNNVRVTTVGELEGNYTYFDKRILVDNPCYEKNKQLFKYSFFNRKFNGFKRLCSGYFYEDGMMFNKTTYVEGQDDVGFSVKSLFNESSTTSTLEYYDLLKDEATPCNTSLSKYYSDSIRDIEEEPNYRGILGHSLYKYEPFPINKPFTYVVYPFETSGSLINDSSSASTRSQLRTNVTSHYFNMSTSYIQPTNVNSLEEIVYIDEDSKGDFFTTSNRIYRGMEEFVCVGNRVKNIFPIKLGTYTPYRNFEGTEDWSPRFTEWNFYTTVAIDKFSEGTHISLKDNQTVLNNSIVGNYRTPSHITAYSPTPIESWDNKFPLVDVVREEVYNRFGGTTKEALESNIWHSAGEAVDLAGDTVKVKWTEGDTYYQRYECLKTFPVSSDSMNQILETVSFMVETRVNLDGRYDRNRENVNLLNRNQSNFNLINTAYSSDNILTYKRLDREVFTTLEYPNTIYWSLPKNAGELVDSWVNINAASNVEVPKDFGKLVKLDTVLHNNRNTVMAIQEKALNMVLYNELSALKDSAGNNIIFSNSGLVSGTTLLTNHGTYNKWSVCKSPNGLYYLDGVNKNIMTPTSSTPYLEIKGMVSWCADNLNNKIWKPQNPYNAWTTQYDNVSKDVLFINNDTALAYNEHMNAFTSFYSYDKVLYLINLKDKCIAVRKGDNGIFEFWDQHNGDYNKFFGKFKPFSFTIISNGTTTDAERQSHVSADKTFTNVEYRMDTYDNSGTYVRDTFDKIEVWDPYQRGEALLHSKRGERPNVRDKFKVWRLDIPRDSNHKRDRMRNPWLFLKLTKDTENTNKTVVYDTIVKFYE